MNKEKRKFCKENNFSLKNLDEISFEFKFPKKFEEFKRKMKQKKVKNEQ